MGRPRPCTLAALALLAVCASPLAGNAACEDAESTISATRTALASGDISAATRGLATLAARNADCVPAILLRAQVAAARGAASEAEELYKRACALEPTRPEPFFELGVFYDSRQQHGRAAEQFRAALDLAPDDPQSWDYLGLSLEALGNFDDAGSAYRMGLARNRGPRFDPMLHYNYGRYLMKQGRLAEARKHLDQAVRLVPGTRAVHYERARLAERLGNPGEALQHGNRALGTPDSRGVILDMQVHYLLSRLHRALGNNQEADKFAALTRRGEIPIEARSRSGR